MKLYFFVFFLVVVSFIKDPLANTNSFQLPLRLESEETFNGSESSPETSNQNEQQANLNSQPNTRTATQPDISSLLFYLDPNLNLSMGFEVNHGEVHLIIEVDHNPTQDQFVFTFSSLYPDLQPVSVIKENLRFGFQNKPVAMLPMIEIQNLGSDSVKYIPGSETFRTHQRINLSKILKEQSDLGRLMDTSGQKYRYEDIVEIRIYALKPFNEGRPSVNDFKLISIPFQGVRDSQIHQILGTQPLADFNEQGKYKVGDQIQLSPQHKLPHRSKDTQWVVLPDLSDPNLLTYELIHNPIVGEKITVSVSAIGFPKVLPKLKSGYFWFQMEEVDGRVTFVMAEEKAKLSPSILLKYIQAMTLVLDNANRNGQDLKESLIAFFKTTPIQIRLDRLEIVVGEILKLNTNEFGSVLQVLMFEQYHFPVIKNTGSSESQSQCVQFLKK